MSTNPYQPPKSDVDQKDANDKYADYSEVPFYRRQWFFWITYIIFYPIALLILIFGDIYYVKKGRVVGFGLANRIVAGLVGAAIIWAMIQPPT